MRERIPLPAGAERSDAIVMNGSSTAGTVARVSAKVGTAEHDGRSARYQTCLYVALWGMSPIANAVSPDDTRESRLAFPLKFIQSGTVLEQAIRIHDTGRAAQAHAISLRRYDRCIGGWLMAPRMATRTPRGEAHTARRVWDGRAE